MIVAQGLHYYNNVGENSWEGWRGEIPVPMKPYQEKNNKYLYFP